MVHRRWIALATVMLIGAACAEPTGSAGKRGEIWLAPRMSDFAPILEGSAPTAPWEQIAGRVDVLALTQGAVRNLPDDALARLVEDLHRRHIALALTILPINWFHETPCGGGVEGYSDPASARKTVAKLQKAGAQVAMIAMDEPLWFGHYYSGKNACRSSLADLAERTSVLVKIFTDAFPNAEIGDTEPFPAVSRQPNWAADYAAWLAAFHAAVGTTPTFLHLDFNWGDPQLNLGNAHDGSNAEAIDALTRKVAGVARRNGLHVGMIYWGGGAGDEAWMDAARLHIREVQAADAGLENAVFVSWSPAPARTFPASDPNALASLIPYFMQQQR